MKNESTLSSRTEEKGRLAKPLISGVLVSYAITCIAFILCALLIRYTAFPETSVSLYVTVTALISVTVAGFDAAGGAGKNGWLWGMAAGAIYAVILILLGTLLNKGLGIGPRSLTLILLSVAGGGLGGVLGINARKS